MKTPPLLVRGRVFCFALLWLAMTATAQNAITYQGRLVSDASPATGTFDMRFSVHDAESEGNQIGVPAISNGVPIIQGLFTVNLDFGPQVFTGAPRWLEIGVRTNGGNAFTTLYPRQLVGSSPYALYAPAAGVAATAASANAIAANAVGTSGLQDHAVSSAKIADGAVTTSDLSSTVRDSTFWKLNGNAGTMAGHFVGTSDGQPLELKVSGQRALRLEPRTSSPNILGGFSGNYVGQAVVGAIIGGGGADGQTNIIETDLLSEEPPGGFPPGSLVPDFGIIGGGSANAILAGKYNTVAGGASNSILGWSQFERSAGKNAISGGFFNRIHGAFSSTISGGESNEVSGWSRFGITCSTIGGGKNNSIDGRGDPVEAATIAGGAGNKIHRSADGAAIGGGYGNVISAYANASTIAGGTSNAITGDLRNSVVAGGYLNRCVDNYGVIAGGKGHWAAREYATIGGGHSNFVSAVNGTIPGGAQAMARSHAQLAYAGGMFEIRGDAQTSVYVCRGVTSNSVPTTLFLDNVSERIKVLDNSTWSFDALVVGRSSQGTPVGHQIRGMISRSGGTTALVGEPLVTGLNSLQTANATITADNVNGSLVVVVTGLDGEVIRWVASIRTVEVMF